MKSLSMRYALAGFMIGVLIGAWSHKWSGGDVPADLIAQYFGALIGTGIAGALVGWGAGALKARQLRRKGANDDRQRPRDNR